MRYLKQNTDQYVTIGALIDKSDGFTTKDNATVTNLNYVLSISTHSGASTHVSGTLSATASNDWGCAAIGHGGMYDVKIPDSDINFVGSCTLCIYYATSYLPVWHEFMVVPANVWDSLMGTDLLDVSVTQLGGVAQSLTDLKDFADTGYDPSTHKVQGVVLTDTVTTLTGNTPQTGDAYAVVKSGGAGDTAAIKTMTDKIGTVTNSGGTATIGAILGDFANSALVTRVADLHTDVADIHTDIGALTIPTAAAIADAVWDEAIADHSGAGKTAQAVSDILTDTGTTLDALIKDIPTVAEFEARSLPAADYTVVTDLGTVQSGDSFAIVNGDHGLVSIQDDVDAIKAKTDKLTFTSGNDLDVNIQKVNDVTIQGDGSGTPWGPV